MIEVLIYIVVDMCFNRLKLEKSLHPIFLINILTTFDLVVISFAYLLGMCQVTSSLCVGQ